MPALMWPLGRKRSRNRWYVTAAHGMYTRATKDITWIPTTSLHIMQVETETTVCGLATTNWQVFWLDDDRAASSMCRPCVAAADKSLR